MLTWRSPRSLFSKNRWIVLAFIVSLLLTASIIFLTTRLYESRPVPQAVQVLAERGISSNAVWEPVTRRVDRFDMVLVPAGCFPMGSTDEQLEVAVQSCEKYYAAFGCPENFADEQPVHEVCITEPYWINRTPVTIGQYALEGRTEDTSADFRARSSPRGIVTWAEASAYCARHGMRLPTEAEWEFAARGPDALIYPFGNEYVLEYVTLRKIGPAPVGEKPEGASWVGALDMSGGISEWVVDWFGSYTQESQTNPIGPAEGKYKVARGGNWFAHAAYLVRTTHREVLDPDHATTTVGFRCVSEFTP